MTWDPTPWAVGGGATLGPEVLRSVGYAATRGGEGIVVPGDCKVRALTVPGTSVLVSPGAVVLPNVYASAGSGQSYVGRNPTDDSVPITATGGSARSDLIVARVLDPQYEGQPPADPNAFQYMRTDVVQGVSSSRTNVAGLNLGYPAYALARIDIPANTATITDAMIVDLRKLVAPRETSELVSAGVYIEETLSSTSYMTWPDQFKPQFTIPTWATHANMIVHAAGIFRGGGYAAAELRARLGSVLIAGGLTLEYDDVSQGNDGRHSFMLTCGGFIPEASRGTTQTAYVQGRRLFTDVFPGSFKTIKGAQMAYDIRFYERAV